jgi:hypothetical protein
MGDAMPDGKPSYVDILKKKKKKKKPEAGFQEVPMDIDKINASFDATQKKE